jgi:hypothetical protein
MLKAEYVRSYPKLAKNGNRVTVFMYKVTGTDAEIQKYNDIREAEGRTSIDEDGNPLYHTLQFTGNTLNLFFTINDKIAVDTSDWDKARAAVEANPWMQAEVARIMINRLNLGGTKPQVTVNQPSNAPFGDLNP